MILPGTEVTVRPLRAVPPPLGTVLVAERDGSLVCHRLVKVRGEDREGEHRWVYHLRGDNHEADDPPLDETKVLGEIESLRFGKFGISADFVPYRVTGNMWAMFPRPARLAMGLVRRLAAPGRRGVETVHGMLQRAVRARPEVNVITAEELGPFQGRAVHLGVAWNRDRTGALRDDIAAGRALLLEAMRAGETEGALLAVTGEIAGAAWLEFLRLAYPRRGTGLDYVLVEESSSRLRDLGFHTFHARSDSPLSERRLGRLGFRPRENLGLRGWSWVKRL
ncbi:MAG: hypothetical protein JRG91_18140 [Deltaproteobacteria bacterium]|nr:hypothetical protein [Deltaproteobacteria bacterium]